MSWIKILWLVEELPPPETSLFQFKFVFFIGFGAQIDQLAEDESTVLTIDLLFKSFSKLKCHMLAHSNLLNVRMCLPFNNFSVVGGWIDEKKAI